MGIWATLDRIASKCLERKGTGRLSGVWYSWIWKNVRLQVSTVGPQPDDGASTSLWPLLAGIRRPEERSLTALSAVVAVA